MKIVVCDITGRTINYDVALCNALYNVASKDEYIEFWCAGLTNKYNFNTHKFFSFVPEKYRSIAHPVTKLLKAIDTIFAYIWISFQLLFRKIDVIHLQWLPFISLGVTGAWIDMLFIHLFKILSPKTKLVFTIHNMCPHSMREEDRPNYNPIFSKALKMFDRFVVHTERTKQEVRDVLGIREDKIFVIYHGIFKPDNFIFSPINSKKEDINIIMFGFQNPYKGTDILVEGLCFLNEAAKKKVHVKICGAFEGDYLNRCRSVNTGVDIVWIPKFLSDQELFQQIEVSDLIILPYRRISQSGVLLLALSTRRLILTSNLPTFVETLKGFDDNAFFESENPKDLARAIEDYLSGQISKVSVLNAIDNLNMLYSWNESAKKTIKMYK